MRRLPGLGVRFNLVVVPIVALGIALMVWADYRHENATLMEAHALHASVVGDVTSAGPLAAWSLPDAAVRRSLLIHLTYGGVLLAMLVFALNVTLDRLILRPVALMRQRVAGIERGHWRAPMSTTGDDELGSLDGDCQRLGPEIDALVGHVLHAERLAILALISKRFEREAEPEVKRIVAIASRLIASHDADARRDGTELARAAAGILKAAHAYDAAFAKPRTSGHPRVPLSPLHVVPSRSGPGVGPPAAVSAGTAVASISSTNARTGVSIGGVSHKKPDH